MKEKHNRPFLGADAKRQGLLAGLLGLLLVLLAFRSPSQFFTVYNLQSMAFQLPELGLISLGMLVVVVTGGIDLSLTNTAALSGICCAMTLNACVNTGMGISAAIALAVAATLASAVVCGAIKGCFVALLGVHPWLVTLGAMSFFRGVSIILTQGGSISGFPKEFYDRIGNGTFLGIPVPMLLLAAATALLGVVLHKTVWGRRLCMIGSGEKVAKFSGISIVGIKFGAYVLSSVLAGVGGLIMVSRYNSAKVDHGSTYLMQSIAVIVLSGANIDGGRANIGSMALTMVLMQVLYTGCSMLGGDRYTVVILTGLILIGILLLNTLMDSGAKRREVQNMRKGGKQTR